VLSPSLFAIYLNDIISLLPLTQRYCVILYADDILIIAPSVSELQNIVNICEHELNRLDMILNVKKYCCVRIGQRHDVKCAAMLCADGIGGFRGARGPCPPPKMPKVALCDNS